MANWALDLGTTNSGVACWDESQGKPRLIELPAVCRKLDAQDPLEAPRLVPSAVHFLENLGALDRLGSWPPLARRFFLGRRALIGRPALERNDGVVHPSFVPTFKPGLSGEALRPLARVGRESVSARDAVHAFLRELLREIKRATGHRVRARGAREIEVGDEPFDKAFFVEGPMRLLCALLDMETRHLLISVNAECKLAIAGGEIRAEVFRSQVPDLLPLLFEIGQRFAQPLNVAQRLAENAQRDPDAGARLRNLLLLAREHPREPETVEVLRAACADSSPEVRLRAARELGNERLDVLMELAENTEDDAVSAQAVSLVGSELPMDHTKAILLLALRRRRLQTARAALEALGSSGAAAAIDVLAKVLAREKGELAAAAAEALGKTGNTAAEPPLLRALEREKSDIQVAAANALARVGSASAVLPLKEAAERSPLDADLFRATRQAIAEIQSRLQGATPGQLSLAGADVGQLSLAPGEAGQLSLTEEAGGRLSLASEEPGQRS